jgi:hypothetical protein
MAVCVPRTKNTRLGHAFVQAHHPMPLHLTWKGMQVQTIPGMAMRSKLVPVCCMASGMSESASRGDLCVLTWQLGGASEKVMSESASR